MNLTRRDHPGHRCRLGIPHERRLLRRRGVRGARHGEFVERSARGVLDKDTYDLFC